MYEGAAQHTSCVSPMRRAISVEPAGGADPHREVAALVDQVHDPIGEVDVEPELRMAHGERRDRRRQVTLAEGDRAGELQRPSRHQRALGHRGFRLLEVGEQLHDALVERAAAFGEREPARRAVQEPRAEVRLEVGDVPRHRRGGDTEAVGSAGETALLDYLGKRTEGEKAVRRLSLFSQQSITFLPLYIDCVNGHDGSRHANEPLPRSTPVPRNPR